jgi:hypothetical protein
MQCKARREAKDGFLWERRNVAMRRPNTFPKGFSQNRRWTALRSLRICIAIRRVARLATDDSG